MTAFDRRAGADLAKFIEQSTDPASPGADALIIYSKDIGGVTQLFARASDGSIYPISPTPYIQLPSGAWMSTAPTPNTGWWIHDDFFVNGVSSSVLNTGAGTGSYGLTLTVGEPGVIVQSVAVAATDGTRLVFGSQNVDWICFGGGIAYFRTNGILSAVPDGVDNTILRHGFLDATTGLVDAVDGVYLEIDRATHGDNNWRLCASNNSVRTKVDSGIAVTAAAQILEIEVNAAGTLAQCRINGVAGANTVAANIPVTTARATKVMLQTSKQLGIAARTYTARYYSAGVSLTTPR